MWHWATPDDAPGAVAPGARSSRSRPRHAKARAIDAFDTQVRPIGPDPADAAILPPHVLDRFLRPYEVVFA